MDKPGSYYYAADDNGVWWKCDRFGRWTRLAPRREG